MRIIRTYKNFILENKNTYIELALKVTVLIEDRKTHKETSFTETLSQYDHTEVMTTRFRYLSKIHKLLSDKYDTYKIRYNGFEWIEIIDI